MEGNNNEVNWKGIECKTPRYQKDKYEKQNAIQNM